MCSHIKLVPLPLSEEFVYFPLKNGSPSTSECVCVPIIGLTFSINYPVVAEVKQKQIRNVEFGRRFSESVVCFSSSYRLKKARVDESDFCPQKEETFGRFKTFRRRNCWEENQKITHNRYEYVRPYLSFRAA